MQQELDEAAEAAAKRRLRKRKEEQREGSRARALHRLLDSNNSMLLGSLPNRLFLGRIGMAKRRKEASRRKPRRPNAEQGRRLTMKVTN